MHVYFAKQVSQQQQQQQQKLCTQPRISFWDSNHFQPHSHEGRSNTGRHTLMKL